MFIDFLSLLLVNMASGLGLLAWYVFRGLDDPDQKRWAPGFAIVGLIATAFGGYLVATWPLPGPYNSLFGEPSVLLGVLFLGAALALSQGWDVLIVAAYGFFAGICAIIMGARILSLNLTAKPGLSAVGFVLSGLGGVFAAPTLAWFRTNQLVRTVGALVLLTAAIVWAMTAGLEYWMHPGMWLKWQPLVMEAMPK